MKKPNIKQLTIDAMLAAMVAVLGSIAIDIGTMKFSLECLPVLISGLMFGPVDGALVGGIGTLVYQIIRYGISATTLLWILPYITCGFVVGLYAKKYNYYNSKKQILFITVVGNIVVLVINTIAIYVDSKVYGYYSVAYVWGAVGMRIFTAIIKAIAMGLILPGILNATAVITGRRKK